MIRTSPKTETYERFLPLLRFQPHGVRGQNAAQRREFKAAPSSFAVMSTIGMTRS
jgi:hypothetical protein